jgi:hypothetical protein
MADMSDQPSDEQIVASLHETMGKVCLASEKLGCMPETIYERARASPKVRGVIRFFRGKLLDAAETALWQAVLKGESWAVRLALIDWGPSRGFSDGAEAWHAPRSAVDVPQGLVQQIALEVLNVYIHIEDRGTRRLAFDAGPVCGNGEPRPLEDGAAPGGDRRCDRADDSGKDRADPAD